MLENQAIATTFFGNWQATKILQVFQLVMEFLIHWTTTEKLIGVLEHCVTLMPSNDQMVEVVRMTGWNLTKEARLLPSYDECPIPNHRLVMNVIAWNCRGALKASITKHATKLANNHNQAIMIIMETCIAERELRKLWTSSLLMERFILT